MIYHDKKIFNTIFLPTCHTLINFFLFALKYIETYTEMIQVFVKTQSGFVITGNVEPSCTILDLKNIIENNYPAIRVLDQN